MKDPHNTSMPPSGSDTFIVDIKFRQNATWQGTVKWTGQEKNFRSALELLKIIDRVLEARHPEDYKEEEA